VDLRWLDAPADDVAAALAAAAPRPRPPWVPTRRQIALHVNNGFFLWFLFFAFLSIGIRVDGVQDGVVREADATAFVVSSVIAALWLAGTAALWWWSRQPMASRTRVRHGRRDLTALANGYEPSPSSAATFSSLVTDHRLGVREYPRFTAGRVEFGTVRPRTARSRPRQYVTVTLASPLPHLVLDARGNDGWGAALPASIARHQRISLEGDFDRTFRTYSPRGYAGDALYVLTPDVMAGLVDHASGFDVEVKDARVVFFRSVDADYTRAEDWTSVDAVLTHVAPKILALSHRYVDERVDGQDAVQVSRASRDTAAWRPPHPIIGPSGRRLDARTPQTGWWPLVGRVAWVVFRTGLYVFPAIFAFAGFMSIVDGR